MNCALCLKNPQNENSHIIPAFVFRWLKSVSATGFLRGTEDPNKRIQDGKKYLLLCEQCEDTLSVFERGFATELFHPYIKSQNVGLHYGESCLKFCVSLVWRALHHLWLTEKDPSQPLQPEFEGILDKPYDTWRLFLLGKIPHPDCYRIFVLPVSDVTSSSIPDTPSKISQYYTCAVDMDLVCNKYWGYVYVKIPYFLIFGTIFNHGKQEFSRNTMISLKEGQLGGTKMNVSSDIMEYIHSRAQSIEAASKLLIEKQSNAILTSAQRDPNRVLRSQCMKSAACDAKLRQGS